MSTGGSTAQDPERPALLGLAAAAAIGLSLGVGLVRWSLADAFVAQRVAPPPGAEALPELAPLGEGNDDEEEVPAAAPPGVLPPPEPEEDGLLAPDATEGPRAAPPSEPERAAALDNGSGPEDSDDPGADGPARPAPLPPLPAEPAFPEGPRRVRIEPGRMAYLRCDGAEIPGQAYPCPRDEPLERAVWDRIERLPRCNQLPATAGEVDLRLVFEDQRQTGVTFRSSEAIDRSLLQRCLGELEAGLTTTVPARRTIASFRFRLVPRP